MTYTEELIEYYSSLPPFAADAAAAPEVQAVPLYNTRDAALLHIAVCYDLAGNAYVAVEHLRGNDTPIYVWRIRPGQPFHPVPDTVVRPAPMARAGGKYDDLELKIGGAGGRDLHVWGVAHEAFSGERDNQIQLAVLAGFVLVSSPVNETEGTEFDASALTAVETGEPVNYELIRQIVQQEIAGLVGMFGSTGVRPGVMEKVEDGVDRLFWSQEELNRRGINDPRPGPFQDRFYPFVKNAAATPLANVLLGQDAWGREMRGALKEIIREVLREGLIEG